MMETMMETMIGSRNRRWFRHRHVAAALAAALFAATTLFAGERGVVNTSRSPHVKFRSVDLDAVRWTAGFWADKLALCRREMIPSVERALLDPGNSEQLANLRIAAGLEKGTHRGTDWSDGDCYKWLESLACVYALTKEPELDRKMDHWIEVIAKAQCPDGYLSTNVGGDARARLQMPHRHELYNMGHLLTAACAHHRATGKDNFLRVARKTADFLDREFRPRPPRLVHFPWNPSAYMGLVELYRTTRDRRYLELAAILIDNRGSSPGGGDFRNGGTDQTQDRVPLRRETAAIGHGVTATYFYAGAADLYCETGEPALLDALRRIWRNVAGRQMYVTGAVGAGEGRSPRGDPLHEAFLGDYELPSRTAYCETCANVGNAMWNWRMLAATGDAPHADLVELVLYNSMLSAVSADGKRFFYCNPLAWNGEPGGPTPHHTAQRWAIHSCYCCPPQVVRTIAGLGGWAYGLSEDAVWVHLYGGSTLRANLPDGSAIALVQDTAYPWEGTVKITVAQAPPRSFALRLRIPPWAEGAVVKVNGRPVHGAARPGAYFALGRTWTAGDVVELDLPMAIRLIEAHPRLKEASDCAAVARGPVVYCLEMPKSPQSDLLWQRGIFLPENVALTPRFEQDLLGGVTVLDGNALTAEGKDRFVEANAAALSIRVGGDPGDSLYRTLQPRRLKSPTAGETPIRLIPYFAWANRGVSSMRVWIPLAR